MKYPIGPFDRTTPYTDERIQAAIADIEAFPNQLRLKLDGITSLQLNTPYRDGGWTIRQVVHHLADSHMNAFMRFKLALTEDNPTIKPYHQDGWASTADNLTGIELSVSILDGIHARLAAILKSMSAEDWSRTFVHPEQNRTITLGETCCLYAWHGNHHIAHIGLVTGT
jgi:hypothetical protein